MDMTLLPVQSWIPRGNLSSVWNMFLGGPAAATFDTDSGNGWLSGYTNGTNNILRFNNSYQADWTNITSFAGYPYPSPPLRDSFGLAYLNQTVFLYGGIDYIPGFPSVQYSDIWGKNL
jgi:hypothetical protein